MNFSLAPYHVARHFKLSLKALASGALLLASALSVSPSVRADDDSPRFEVEARAGVAGSLAETGFGYGFSAAYLPIQGLSVGIDSAFGPQDYVGVSPFVAVRALYLAGLRFGALAGAGMHYFSGPGARFGVLFGVTSDYEFSPTLSAGLQVRGVRIRGIEAYEGKLNGAWSAVASVAFRF